MTLVAWGIARDGRLWRVAAIAWWPAMLVHGIVAAAVTWAVGESRDAGRGFVHSMPDAMLDHLPVEILQYWAFIAVIAAVETRTRLAERDRAAQRLEAELARARLDALRARLRPHFLFNTLQSVAMLIPREPEAAQRMVVHLGDLLRAGFAGDRDAQETPLGEELRLVRAYLAIEEERFRDRLRVAWEIDDAAMAVLVPELLLQPLVENALTHGLWPRQGPGTLTVRAALRTSGDTLMLELHVEDDGVGLPDGWRDGSFDGTGLGATRSRLLGLHGDRASLRVVPRDGGGTVVIVRMPARDGASGAPG
jgi:sensor histidine kinase YesM